MALPYGMDDAQLASIIKATDDAVGQMRSLNARVTGQAEDYIHANNSESGRLMQNGLYQWTDEFNTIVGDLDQLNQKVALVRQQNAAASHGATDYAQGANL